MLRLKIDSAKAVDTFVTRVAGSGHLFMLECDDGVAGCPGHNYDGEVIPVFSDAAYARRGAACWGSEYRVGECDLETFLHRVLPRLAETGTWLGPNWDPAMAGAEVAPQDLAARIKAVLPRV